MNKVGSIVTIIVTFILPPLASFALSEAAAEPAPSQVQRGVGVSVNLDKYSLVLSDDFTNDLSAYDGKTGVWSTGPRRDVLATNSPQCVFLDGDETDAAGNLIGIDPIRVDNGVLRIGAGVIPDSKRDDIVDLLGQVGQERYSDTVKYYTGNINTSQSWAQTYGYFEIVAQVPAGKGHWSAFWLSTAGIGWPPEIDIFEAYGKGLQARTGRDNAFNTAVFFDAVDPSGEETQNTDIVNPYFLDENGIPEEPSARTKAGGEQFVFHNLIDAKEQFDADIYREFWTYALEWTPEHIVFYFGKDRDSLVEIYRTPTPEDLHSPMNLIANDQIGSTFGWNPVAGLDAKTFAPDNDLKIDKISMYALKPTESLVGTGAGDLLVDGAGSKRIVGTSGDDIVVSGGGRDMIELGGGKDAVFVERSVDNTIISGFGRDDRLVLEGFFFDGAADALARLTQVGDDVWLINGADPANPQTILFRDSNVSDFVEENFVVRWSTTRDIWSSALLNPARLADTDRDGVVDADPRGSKLTDAGSFSGAMTLNGSSAGDIYFIGRGTTVIKEAPGGGVDTVRSNTSYTLADNVENLVSDSRRDGLRLTGNDMDNRIESGAVSEILAGGKGDDLILLGSGGADRVVYAPGDGHDTLVGFGRDDVLVLDGVSFPSWDALRARLHGLGDDTVLDLGTGQSVVFRGVALNSLSAGNFSFTPGATSVAGEGADPWWRPNGLTPPDWYRPQRTDNVMQGGNGDDVLRGTADRDWIHGGAGNDTLRGFGGDDQLFGDAGNDRLDGGSGNDRLIGGLGNDRMFGNEGADLFVLAPGAGNDTIMDFSVAEGDRLDVAAFGGPGSLRVSQHGAWVRLTAVDTGEVISVRSAVEDVRAALDWHMA